jgi:hypothetical protein
VPGTSVAHAIANVIGICDSIPASLNYRLEARTILTISEIAATANAPNAEKALHRADLAASEAASALFCCTSSEASSVSISRLWISAVAQVCVRDPGSEFDIESKTALTGQDSIFSRSDGMIF